MTDRTDAEKPATIFIRPRDICDGVVIATTYPFPGGVKYVLSERRAIPPLDPTKDMIEAGAQRLVRWETGKEKWPDAWDKLHVRAARNDAERVWRSMWLQAIGEGK